MDIMKIFNPNFNQIRNNISLSGTAEKEKEIVLNANVAKEEGISYEEAKALRAIALAKTSIDKSTPIYKNPELIDAFCNLEYEEDDGFPIKFGDEVGLRATLSGKKPLTFFDDDFNPKAMNTIISYANTIEQQTRGKLKVIVSNQSDSYRYLHIFNTKKLKETISENFDFYKMHFPDCESTDDIENEIYKRTAAGELRGSLIGVTLGFPLGDSLFFGSLQGENFPKEKLYSLLKGNEWAEHRKLIEKGMSESLLNSTRMFGEGYITWNPNTPQAQKLDSILLQDMDEIFQTNIMDYFERLIKEN